jgi:hypothetical protein
MNPLLIIEPNLSSSSGHYADFVRSVGACARDAEIEVYADPAADAMLAVMEGVSVCATRPRVGERFAEWRTICRAVRRRQLFLVLTADARHAAAVSVAASATGMHPSNARLFFHRPPTTTRDRFFTPFGEEARQHALAITATEQVAERLRADGWRRVVCVPYPTTAPETLPSPEPFRHLLMAGAARVNKGLDIVTELAGQWAREGRSIPLLVQVSKKRANSYGSREGKVVQALISSGYRGLCTDVSAPGRDAYLERFRGALVLAPYAREQFASQVSGVVLDALLQGAPVIATSGTWPGVMVERFGAGVTIAERTSTALAAAIDQVLADWPAYAERACAAARVLAAEHDPSHLLAVLVGDDVIV